MSRIVLLAACAALLAAPSSASAERGDVGRAVIAGNIEKVKELLAADPGRIEESHYGLTPLQWAIAEGKEEIRALLIEKGATVDILAAAAMGDEARVKALLDEKPERVKGPVGDGTTPLHWAVQHGQLKVATLLIERGADVNARDGFKRTPLHLAADVADEPLIKLLVEKGADVRVENQDKETSLDFAANRAEPACLRAILMAGADPNRRGRFGDTALHVIARQSGESAAESIGMFDEAGADLNAQNDAGNTPLHDAAWFGNPKNVTRLVDCGAELNRRNKDGLTPLEMVLHHPEPGEMPVLLVQLGARIDLGAACGLGRVDLIGKLLDRDPAAANAPGPGGWRPLHWAAFNGRTEAAKLLLDRGAKIDASDDKGDTALHLAALNKQKDACELLAARGANVSARNSAGKTAVLVAGEHGWKDVVAVLAEKTNVDIFEAIRLGMTDRARALVTADKTLLKARGDQLRTPLHAAVASGRKEIAEFLIAEGADLAALDRSSWTPLHVAAFWSMKDMVQLLLDKGADPNGRPGSRQTPLHLAVSRGTEGRLEVAELLLAHGADANAVDGDHRPLFYAEQRWDKEMVELLKKHGAKGD